MPYPEYLTAPMRQELNALGNRECRTAADVDEVLKSPGVVMMVVNSVCGCAAGKARPGIAMALQHQHKPDVVASVFAGADLEATDRARHYFTGFAPVVAVDRAAPRRQAALHDRASRHRSPSGPGDRRHADDGVRQVLRASDGASVRVLGSGVEVPGSGVLGSGSRSYDHGPDPVGGTRGPRTPAP